MVGVGVTELGVQGLTLRHEIRVNFSLRLIIQTIRHPSTLNTSLVCEDRYKLLVLLVTVYLKAYQISGRCI